MTTQLLDLTGLVDHWGGSVATGLTLVARARSGSKDAVRSANGSVTFSSVLIARYSATTGVWSPPLALEALAAGCYWELRAVEDSTRDSLFRTVQFPDTRPVIEWADLVDIDPATTVPIVPTPPSAAELLAEAETLLAEAQALVASLASGGAGGFLSGQYPNPGVNISALDAAITSRIQDDGTDGSESATHAAVKALAAALIAAQATSDSATYATLHATASVSLGTATTALPGSTLIAYAEPSITYFGGVIAAATNTAYGQVVPAAGAPSTTITAAFTFEGEQFEFRINGADSSSYRLTVNGQRVTDDWQPIPADGADHLALVDLGRRDVWDIKIELLHALFGGVRVLATDTIAPPLRKSLRRVFVTGDSFEQGITETGGAYIQTPGWIPTAGDVIGIEDVWNRGVGGTGLLTGPTYRSRLTADVIPYVPDVLIVPGSINDAATTPTPGALTAEITALYAQMKAALPDCVVIGTSTVHVASPSPIVTANDAELKAAWTGLGAPYIDLTGMGSGSGNVTSPAGDGVADYLACMDGAHPTFPLGYDYVGTRIGVGVASILAALPGPTDSRKVPLAAVSGAFTPAHSTVTALPFAPQAGETRWNGTTWRGPSGNAIIIVKVRLNDAQGAGADIAIGPVVAGSEFLTWHTLGSNANRDTITSFDMVYLHYGDTLHAETYVDNATDVGFQQLNFCISPV